MSKIRPATFKNISNNPSCHKFVVICQENVHTLISRGRNFAFVKLFNNTQQL